jgi:hypothetical protein
VRVFFRQLFVAHFLSNFLSIGVVFTQYSYIGVYNILKHHPTCVDTRISFQEGKGIMLFYQVPHYDNLTIKYNGAWIVILF